MKTTIKAVVAAISIGAGSAFAAPGGAVLIKAAHLFDARTATLRGATQVLV